MSAGSLAAHDVEGRLQGLQVLHADDYGSRVAMLGNHDTTMLALKAVHNFREPVLDVRERHLPCSRHGYMRSGSPSEDTACPLTP